MEGSRRQSQSPRRERSGGSNSTVEWSMGSILLIGCFGTRRNGNSMQTSIETVDAPFDNPWHSPDREQIQSRGGAQHDRRPVEIRAGRAAGAHGQEELRKGDQKRKHCQDAGKAEAISKQHVT